MRFGGRSVGEPPSEANVHLATELNQYPVNRIGASEPEGYAIDGEGGIGQAGSTVVCIQATGYQVQRDPAERGRRVAEGERAGESEDDGREVGPLGGEESGGDGREADRGQPGSGGRDIG